VTATDLAIVGVGKIARDQHLPSIEKSDAFRLAATVSRHTTVDGVANFATIDELLVARPDIAAVSLCMPPQARFEAAWKALSAGKHVMLEKPPGASVAEVQALVRLARDKGAALFATWHSRHAHAVPQAKALLAQRTIRSVDIVWKEDVRRWHPGQEWIWQPGGLGVFDPGINALSILTEIMPHPVHVASAALEFPENRAAPIAAELAFADHLGTPIRAAFDWRQTGPQSWDIDVATVEGHVRLSSGGAVLDVDGKRVVEGPDGEYDGLYRHFAALVAERRVDVDLAPLIHVADAFMLGKRVPAPAFHDDG
jgi:D-galactose 1-dehydrogenase